MFVSRGQQFGDLTAVYLSYEDILGTKLWECSCVCGGSILVDENDLFYRITAHCTDKLHGVHEIPDWYFVRLIQGADSRNHSFTVSKEYIWEVFLSQDRKCVFTGELLVFGYDSNTAEASWLQTASLDRKNSKLGYEVGNVQWIHKTINRMKGQLKDNSFIEWCGKITDHQRRSLLAELLSSKSEIV